MLVSAFIALAVSVFAADFNDDLRAVHYSIVSSGLDKTTTGAELPIYCEDCSAKRVQDKIQIEVSHEEQADFIARIPVTVNDQQNVRLTVYVADFLGNLASDSALAKFEITTYLTYYDGSTSDKVAFKCVESCVDGHFKGQIDIKNSVKGDTTLTVEGKMQKMDLFVIESLSVGSLILKSEVFDNSSGIVTNSCDGLLTGSVLFGKAGVGKSTVASLVSSKPGLFEVGTSGQGTTTLGTWLSSSLVTGPYAQFSDNQLVPLDDMPSNIPPLLSLNLSYSDESNLVFMDTEGLDYQTEFGDNYDVVTILPHTLIAENVFLLVRDRVNPAEVVELLDKLAKAAEKTEGTLSHRNGKLFGRFIIVVNKAQDISKSDQEELELLKQNNPTLITRVMKYFFYGPEVIMLPRLQWNYEDQPDFNSEGFFLDYDMISVAHPPLRDRMFYGLHRISDLILRGIPTSSDYIISCKTFEPMLARIYNATSEDVIDINQLDYEFLLIEAKSDLDVFVSQFDLTDINLTNEFMSAVCPEANEDLVRCIKDESSVEVTDFYQLCVEQIEIIFARGKDDLKKHLDNILFPRYVTGPVSDWFATCSSLHQNVEMYSTQFLETFSSSDFFNVCRQSVEGKLLWNEWEECSKSCKDNDKCGVQMRVAKECVPEYSVCKEVQIQRRDCNCQECPEEFNTSGVPAGTILPWIPKPNNGDGLTVKYDSVEGYIKCDGMETCTKGVFTGKSCTDLEDYALIGAHGKYKVLQKYGATMPDHHHPHTHLTEGHTHIVPYSDQHPKGRSHCGMGGTGCSEDSYKTRNVETTSKTTKEKILIQETMGVKESTIVDGGSKTTLGDLYPKNLRVEFLFKCY